jgi:hypothetical protein
VKRLAGAALRIVPRAFEQVHELLRPSAAGAVALSTLHSAVLTRGRIQVG